LNRLVCHVAEKNEAGLSVYIHEKFELHNLSSPKRA